MKFLLILILSPGIMTCFSQDFQALDKHKIFHGFAFGSSASDFGKDLTLDLTISYGAKYYKYRGKSLKELEGFKTHDINLGFQDDQLNYIDLYFKKLDDNDYDLLLSRLEKKYGQATLFTALDKGVVNAVEWKGESLTMQLYRYNENTVDSADRNMTVFIISTH